ILRLRHSTCSLLFPYTTLFRSPPKLLAGRCIIGDRHIPWLNIIEYAVDHDGRCFDATVGGNISIPGQTDILHIAIINLLERAVRSEEHTSELQSRENLVCRLLL